MKLERIHVTDFLGLRAVDVRTQARVQLFAGANGAGKSSLRDAVALALTADLGRISLKKEAGALVREGAALAVAEIVTADQDAYRVSITAAGAMKGAPKAGALGEALPYALDGQRLAALSATERRAFLFGLMGLQTEPAAVKPRLMARLFAGRTPTAAEAERLERTVPLLRAGFDAAHEQAKARATEAKTAWRLVTGETYGSEKAKSWRAQVPAYDKAAAAELATQIKHADAALESWQRTIGQLQAEDQRRAKLRQQLPALREHAMRLDRLANKLAHDEAGLAEAQQALQAAQDAAGGAGPRVGLVHDLAKALDALLGDFFPEGTQDHGTQSVRIAGAALEAYTAAHGPVQEDCAGDAAEACARLPELRRQLALMQSAVANSRRDVDAARRAGEDAARIEAELAEVFDAAGLAEALQQADAIKAQRAALVKRSDELRSVKALADAAQAKTDGASAHHADVEGWAAIADALGPDGIPGELLAEALGPINQRLQQHALDTEWPQVQISADMAVSVGGREYRLASESERWRADAMLAETVAHISGTRLLVLDRADVLDLPGRQEMLGWLDVLADTGEIDTALVFATLKAPPTGLPQTIEAHWLAGGQLGQLAQAA